MHSRTAFDRILRQATIAGPGRRPPTSACGAERSRRSRPGCRPTRRRPRLDGRLVLPGLRRHPHPSRQGLPARPLRPRPRATWLGAIKAVSELKRDFTVEDVYERGARVLEKAILKGTTHMRTHVEVDPRVGLRSFEAVKQLKRDYAWAIDLSICVFPQEGLTNDPGTEELLVEALSRRRRSARRLSLHRQRSEGADRRGCSTLRRGSASISISISISTSIRPGC